MKLVALMLGACKLVPEPVENAVHVLTLCLCVLARVVGDVLLPWSLMGLRSVLL